MLKRQRCDGVNMSSCTSLSVGNTQLSSIATTARQLVFPDITGEVAVTSSNSAWSGVPTFNNGVRVQNTTISSDATSSRSIVLPDSDGTVALDTECVLIASDQTITAPKRMAFGQKLYFNTVSGGSSAICASSAQALNNTVVLPSTSNTNDDYFVLQNLEQTLNNKKTISTVQPIYTVYGTSGAQTIPTGTPTNVTQAVFNGGTYTQNTTITWNGPTGMFTVLEAGTYLVHASAIFNSSASTARRFFRIQSSDGQIADSTYSLANENILMSVTGVFTVTANATFNVVAYQNTGANLNLISSAAPTHKFTVLRLF